MDKINRLIEYQKADVGLLKIENELRLSKEAKLAMDLQKFSKDTQAELSKFNRRAEECLASHTKAGQSFVTAEAELAELTDVPADLKALIFYGKQLEKLGKKLEALDAEAKQACDEIAYIKKHSEVKSKQRQQADSKLEGALNAFAAKKAEAQKQAEGIKVQLKGLEKGLDPVLFERYKKIRADKRKLPAIAAVNGSDCSACGMNLFADVLSKFSAQIIVQDCPNCGVMIYKG